MKDNGVIEIPAFELKSKGEDGNEKKKRVAAYCRVSTDNAKQLDSLDAQIRHYESYIKSNNTGFVCVGSRHEFAIIFPIFCMDDFQILIELKRHNHRSVAFNNI